MKKMMLGLGLGCSGVLLLSFLSVAWAQQRESASSPTTAAPATPSNSNPTGTAGTQVSFSPNASWRNAPRRYIVQPGDTLWDISRRFLGSPWYWPKLWTKNPQIQNPHWIFPGNIIRFSTAGEVAVTARAKPKKREWAMVSRAGTDTKKSIDISTGGKIVSVRSLGLEGRTIIERRESFVDSQGLKDAGKILGTSDKRTLLTARDILFLNFKNLRNVRVGEQYSVYRKMGRVNDPVSGRLVGYIIRLNGVIQITDVDKRRAQARVSKAFREIQRGDLVGRYINHKVRVKIRRNEALVRGYILRATTPVSISAQFYQIFINRGRRHGVRQGNVFSIFRRGGILRERISVVNRNRRFSREFIGRAVVIEVRRDSCVAVVTQSVVEIHDGDEVETSLSD